MTPRRGNRRLRRSKLLAYDVIILPLIKWINLLIRNYGTINPPDMAKKAPSSTLENGRLLKQNINFSPFVASPVYDQKRRNCLFNTG